MEISVEQRNRLCEAQDQLTGRLHDVEIRLVEFGHEMQTLGKTLSALSDSVGRLHDAIDATVYTRRHIVALVTIVAGIASFAMSDVGSALWAMIRH